MDAMAGATPELPTLEAPPPSDGMPVLPGEVSGKRAPRKPTPKQLEALEANRRKRQAEAVARKAIKAAEKASAQAAVAVGKKEEADAVAATTAAVTAEIVAAIPPSQAATARKRSADIAELPHQLRLMEAKFEARLQTMMDTMSKLTTPRIGSGVPVPINRYFPRGAVPGSLPDGASRLSDPIRQKSRILSRAVVVPTLSEEEEEDNAEINGVRFGAGEEGSRSFL